MVQALLMELQHEADTTRKLFAAIPDDVLTYRPNDFNWTIAELASHIAETYNWWESTLHQDALDMANYSYEKGDISNMERIRAKLEENIAVAMRSLENYPDEKLMGMWSMKNNGVDMMPPMPRVQVIRGFLMNHLYHHRGEMIAYLRVNGKRVPGLYGPSYDDMQQPAE